MLLAEADGLITELADAPLDDVLAAYEVWASGTMTLFEPVGIPPRPIADPKDVVRAAQRNGGPGAALVAEAMAIYGPLSSRVAARRCADSVTATLADGAVPEWVTMLGRVEIGDVWLMADIWGDGGTLLVEYTDVTGAVLVAGCTIDTVGGGAADGFLAGAPLDAIHELVDGDPHTSLTKLDPADAAATVATAIDVRASFVNLGDDDDDHADLLALVAHRFGLLPEGGEPLFEYVELSEDRREALIERFLQRRDAADLDDAAAIAGTICDFAGYCDGDPLRWSPARVDVFVGGWVPAKVIADDDWYRNLPPVLREWLRFAAEEVGLVDDGLEINLAQVDHAMGLMQENRRDASKRSPTSNIVADMQADGIDMLDQDAVNAWLEEYNRRPRDERY